MKKELFAVFKNGRFIEAAWCLDGEGNLDHADRYIRSMEKKLGLKGFSYKYGKQAEESLPRGYKPRSFFPRLTNTDREFAKYVNTYTTKAKDDGVIYEE